MKTQDASKGKKQPAPEAQLKDADFTKVSDLEKNFKFFKKINDPRFGEISIIQNPTSKEFLAVREKKINDRAEAGRQVISTRKRLALKHPNLLNLLDYSVAKQSELCSSFYILRLIYEYPRSDLRKETQERQRQGQSFTDAELTHILYQQVSAGSYLQSQEQHHGDIQPLYIGYDRDQQVSKLIDKTDGPTDFAKTKQLQKNRLISGHNLYQSPTTYSNLKKGNLNFTVDPSKEDAFALGLVLIEAGNGQPIQNIYDNSKGAVDSAALQSHVENFNKRFGTENSLLTSTVASLVTMDETARPSARQVESSIPPYDTIKSFLVDRQQGVQAQGGINQLSAVDKAATQAVTDNQYNQPNHDLYSNLSTNNIQTDISNRNIEPASQNANLSDPSKTTNPINHTEQNQNYNHHLLVVPGANMHNDFNAQKNDNNLSSNNYQNSDRNIDSLPQSNKFIGQYDQQNLAQKVLPPYNTNNQHQNFNQNQDQNSNNQHQDLNQNQNQNHNQNYNQNQNYQNSNININNQQNIQNTHNVPSHNNYQQSNTHHEPHHQHTNYSTNHHHNTNYNSVNHGTDNSYRSIHHESQPVRYENYENSNYSHRSFHDNSSTKTYVYRQENPTTHAYVPHQTQLMNESYVHQQPSTIYSHSSRILDNSYITTTEPVVYRQEIAPQSINPYAFKKISKSYQPLEMHRGVSHHHIPAQQEAVTYVTGHVPTAVYDSARTVTRSYRTINPNPVYTSSNLAGNEVRYVPTQYYAQNAMPSQSYVQHVPEVRREYTEPTVLRKSFHELSNLTSSRLVAANPIVTRRSFHENSLYPSRIISTNALPPRKSFHELGAPTVLRKSYHELAAPTVLRKSYHELAAPMVLRKSYHELGGVNSTRVLRAGVPTQIRKSFGSRVVLPSDHYNSAGQQGFEYRSAAPVEHLRAYANEASEDLLSRNHTQSLSSFENQGSQPVQNIDFRAATDRHNY